MFEKFFGGGNNEQQPEVKKYNPKSKFYEKYRQLTENGEKQLEPITVENYGSADYIWVKNFLQIAIAERIMREIKSGDLKFKGIDKRSTDDTDLWSDEFSIEFNKALEEVIGFYKDPNERSALLDYLKDENNFDEVVDHIERIMSAIKTAEKDLEDNSHVSHGKEREGFVEEIHGVIAGEREFLDHPRRNLGTIENKVREKRDAEEIRKIEETAA
ncbi:MAG: hypothetical protein WCW87_02660 [Candidatus Paceibacterota bacterium]